MGELYSTVDHCLNEWMEWSPEEWKAFNPGCSNLMGMTINVDQDYLGSCWAEYYNSGDTAKWLGYDCRGGRVVGQGVEFMNIFSCDNSGQNCSLIRDGKSQLEAAGFVFSRDGSAVFDQAAWDAYAASSNNGYTNYLSLPFIRVVVSPQDRLVEAIVRIGQHNLPAGASNALLAKIRPAIRALDAGMTEAACGSLGALVSHCQAQSGKDLPEVLAVELISMAQGIRQEVGCP